MMMMYEKAFGIPRGVKLIKLWPNRDVVEVVNARLNKAAYEACPKFYAVVSKTFIIWYLPR